MTTILALNPGSTSTKVALYKDGYQEVDTLVWDKLGLALKAQISPRLDQIQKWLNQKLSDSQLTAVVARGGLLKPLNSGIYAVDDAMLDDAIGEKRGSHPANLGPILADKIASIHQVPAFVVDPVSVDEMWTVAKVSGTPLLQRQSFAHNLNIRAAVKQTAAKCGKAVIDTRFVVAHLGGGISIAAVVGGKIVDVNNARDEGPFSVERSGGLPFGSVLDLCSENEATADRVKQTVLNESGLHGYLGTGRLSDIVEATDEKSQAIYRAFVYQIAKEIGAYATVLTGKHDGIILTGGMTLVPKFVTDIMEYVNYLGEFHVIPGELEMQALIDGALSVIEKRETPLTYQEATV